VVGVGAVEAAAGRVVNDARDSVQRFLDSRIVREPLDRFLDSVLEQRYSVYDATGDQYDATEEVHALVTGLRELRLKNEWLRDAVKAARAFCDSGEYDPRYDQKRDALKAALSVLDSDTEGDEA
jgi:hypothetical protein